MCFCKRLQASAQNPVHLGDGHAVVDHGDAGGLGDGDPVLHGGLVEHTAAAVDHQVEAGKVLGELSAGAKGEVKNLSGVIPNPAGDLHRADVVALAVVGAALGDQDPVPVLQLGKGLRPGGQCGKLAFVPGEENGKGGKWDRRRNQGRDFSKGLGVCDHQARRFFQPIQHGGELFRLAADGDAVQVQQLPKRLLLGQDQAALGGAFVNGDDQNDRVAGGDQIGQNEFRRPGGAPQIGQPFLQFVHARAGARGDKDRVQSLPLEGKVARSAG